MRFFKKAKKYPGWMAVGFTSHGVSAVHAERRTASERPVIKKVHYFPESGEASAETLARIAKEIGLSHYQCSTVLRNGEYQLLSVEAPNVPPDELKTAIRWKLRDMLDYRVDDATVDVVDVPPDKNAPVRNHTMYAVAARNQLIQQRQSLFAEAGIPLMVIDIPEMAQRNVSALLGTEERGIAMLTFDEAGGLLTFTYRGELYLSRRIEVGAAQLTDGGDGQRDAHHERITLEIQRSLDHFDRQFHFIALSRLVLGPAGEGGAALKDALAANLYVPVEMLDLGAVVDLNGVPELAQPNEQQRHFMTLGAALRFEEKVL